MADRPDMLITSSSGIAERRWREDVRSVAFIHDIQNTQILSTLVSLRRTPSTYSAGNILIYCSQYTEYFSLQLCSLQFYTPVFWRYFSTILYITLGICKSVDLHNISFFYTFPLCTQHKVCITNITFRWKFATFMTWIMSKVWFNIISVYLNVMFAIGVKFSR